MINALGVAFTHNPDDDQWANRCMKDWAKACLLGPFSGMFIAGSLAEAYFDKATYEYWKKTLRYKGGRTFQSASPLEGKLDYLFKTTGRTVSPIAEMFSEWNLSNKDKEDLLEDVNKAIDALIPIEKHARRVYENIEHYNRNVKRPVERTVRRVEKNVL